MRVMIDGVRLYFDVDGAGLTADGATMATRPTLVLLHGGPGGDHSLFKPEFSRMADTAQVVYLDQRGSGRSDVATADSWTWDRWADDVAVFCQALDIARPVLVGSSSGGLVAMTCAVRHPDLVAGLVLDSPLGAPMTFEESLEVFERRGGTVARDAARAYLGGDNGPAATDDWQRHCLPLYTNAHDTHVAVRLARALMNNAVQEHFRAGGCGPTDLGERLGEVVCPTLILAGDDDPVSPSVGARRLASALTASRVTLRVFDGVGHAVFRQHPPAFEDLREFLGQLPGASPDR